MCCSMRPGRAAACTGGARGPDPAAMAAAAGRPRGAAPLPLEELDVTRLPIIATQDVLTVAMAAPVAVLQMLLVFTEQMSAGCKKQFLTAHRKMKVNDDLYVISSPLCMAITSDDGFYTKTSLRLQHIDPACICEPLCMLSG